ncbi:MAG: hypothetical protein OEY67_00190 [Gammaproteobacteria bacterium]|nr:hypothetical protein [Gammaproteobacteria bacterium]
MSNFPFTIPGHIQWIAQDSNGVWWGYTAEPHRHDTGWYENETGEYIRLGVTESAGWERSLQRVINK